MNNQEETTRQSSRFVRIILGVVICLHIVMLGWEAAWNSPTIDEPAYLAAGVSHWEFGRFDLAKVSPPLVRLVAAIPVHLAPHQTDWGSYRIGPGIRAEHGVGRDFMVANGRETFWLFTIARWACIPFSLVGAYFCYRWSYELWGTRSAVAAVLLWCFSPNILAHGGMMTPDVGVTALSLAAAYLYWRWSQAGTWRMAATAGIVLGLAVLAKTNAVVLLPLLPVISLAVAVGKLSLVNRRGLNRELPTLDGTAETPDLPALGSSNPGDSTSNTNVDKAVVPITRLFAQLALSLVLAMYAINLGYGFEGSLERLDKYEFASTTFRGDTEGVIGNRFRDTAIGWLPVPFPKAFLEGVDLQRKDFENPSSNTMTYLRGEWFNHSWWWYYLYVVAIKVPLGAWALLLISVALQFKAGLRSWLRPEILSLMLPGLALFAIASSQTGFGHSLRYVLPAFPFAFIFASGAFRDPVPSRGGLLAPCYHWFSTLVGRGRTSEAEEVLGVRQSPPTAATRSLSFARVVVAWVALMWHMVSSLAVYPHSLSYFNELAGGPKNGHAHLLDGNLDWSQDLLYLEDWIRKHPEARPIHVGFWGFLPLKDLQADYSEFDFHRPEADLETKIPPGWYAISVNHLRHDFRMGNPKYAEFLKRRPDAMAGYSVYIYHVTAEDKPSP